MQLLHLDVSGMQVSWVMCLWRIVAKPSWIFLMPNRRGKLTKASVWFNQLEVLPFNISLIMLYMLYGYTARTIYNFHQHALMTYVTHHGVWQLMLIKQVYWIEKKISISPNVTIVSVSNWPVEVNSSAQSSLPSTL